MALDSRLVGTLSAVFFTCYLYTAWTNRMRVRGGLSTGFGGRLPRRNGDTADSTAESTAENSAGANTDSSSFEPSIADVLVIKSMLTKGLSLPPEIVDTITDLAECWPHTTTEASFQDDPTRTARGSTGPENVFLIRSSPLGLHSWRRVSRGTETSPIDTRPIEPRPLGTEFSADDFQEFVAAPTSLLAQPCRRIIFTINSHDQGFGGGYDDRGTYNSAWTWFEAGLERWCKTSPATIDPAEQETEQSSPQQPSLQVDDLCTVFPEVKPGRNPGEYAFKHPLFPQDHLTVQKNVVAERDFKVHRIVWNHTDDIDPEHDTEAAVRLEQEGRGKATGNGQFVRDLKLGDVVTLWAKARFPNWANHVGSVRLDVYYAI